MYFERSGRRSPPNMPCWLRGSGFCRDVSRGTLLVNMHGTRYDISLCKIKSCRSIATQAIRDFLQFFINPHLAGSIYRCGLEIFLEVFALESFPLTSFLHVKIKRATAHSKSPLKLQNHASTLIRRITSPSGKIYRGN